ncbi:MAG: hypothetical protein J6B87_00205 [Clostridia bacterium]|nr:hypothetical protein [Clostridia bacterium]
MSKKMITVLLIVISIMMYSFSFATNNWTIGKDVTPTSISGLQNTAVSVLGVMQWGGYIIAVGMLIWVGIKYVTSGAGEKAKAKETLIPIVIGAILIAAAVTIASAIFGAVSTK